MRLPNVKMLLHYPLECKFWSNLMEPLNGKRLSEVREHPPQRLSKAKERHMHWNLIDSTLQGAPVWGPLSMVQSVVINFTSKVY